MKDIKEVYVVFGYMNSGSGSLTYPEDFETEGFYLVRKDAQDHVDRLNRENGIDENGDWLDDEEEDHDDQYDQYDGMVYTVDVVENISHQKKK
jgi:hypothetical protein